MILPVYIGKVLLSWENKDCRGPLSHQQMIHVLARFQRAHPDRKLAIVWDNAPWHTAKELTKLFKKGELFENIKTIMMLPYAPDHNPIEHVWNQGMAPIKQDDMTDEAAVPRFTWSRHGSQRDQSSILFNHGHKGAIANLQRETPMLTFSAFEQYVRSGEFPYDFEHLPIARPGSDLV